jgi:hypothetical protein
MDETHDAPVGRRDEPIQPPALRHALAGALRAGGISATSTDRAVDHRRDPPRRERGRSRTCGQAVAEDYETVKRELACRHPHDREAYTGGKAELVRRLTADAHAWRDSRPSLS